VLDDPVRVRKNRLAKVQPGRIRQEPWGKAVVIVALTGWGQEEDRRRSQEAGFDHHLVNPVEPAALMQLLAGLSDAART
jgi:CheY-like chemotaxis protein